MRISIHALREEGDGSLAGLGGHPEVFLSTPSARRATRRGPFVPAWLSISIHALREEGDPACSPPRVEHRISIHALREEGDADLHDSCLTYGIFLSTPSARRATVCRAEAPAGQIISIHALREEGDQRTAQVKRGDPIFLSTPSARRATNIGWMT